MCTQPFNDAIRGLSLLGHADSVQVLGVGKWDRHTTSSAGLHPGRHQSMWNRSWTTEERRENTWIPWINLEQDLKYKRNERKQTQQLSWAGDRRVAQGNRCTWCPGQVEPDPRHLWHPWAQPHALPTSTARQWQPARFATSSAHLPTNTSCPAGSKLWGLAWAPGTTTTIHCFSPAAWSQWSNGVTPGQNTVGRGQVGLQTCLRLLSWWRPPFASAYLVVWRKDCERWCIHSKHGWVVRALHCRTG